MQAVIKATSSHLDDKTVLIEVTLTIGEVSTTTRVAHDVDDMMDNRYLSGTLEERVEAMRQSAERMTEKAVQLHFQTLAKIATPEPVVEEVKSQGEPVTTEDKPVKKTRAKRQPKAAV